MFILYTDWRKDDDAEETASMMDAHRRYYAYVEAHRDRFPPNAYELAAARWRQNFNDHRALHDSWVENFRFVDRSLPGADKDRDNDFELVALGAYHDGRIRLRYRNIHSVAVSRSDVRAGPVEIYRDEIRLSEDGLVVHEIEFLARPNWLIECEDIEQYWEPIGNGESNP